MQTPCLQNVFRAQTQRRRRAIFARTAPLLTLACLSGVIAIVPPPSASARDRKREGDVLRIFDNASVYVVTNDDPSVAEALLGTTRQRERRVFTLDEWKKMPDSIRQFVSVVHLINREKLPDGMQVPARCALVEPDELYFDAVRLGQRSGVTYQVAISAPDGAWLRQGIAEFKRLTEPPRKPQRRPVGSLAVIPVGANAAQAGMALVQDGSRPNRRAHLLMAGDREAVFAPRLAAMDEIILIDRSAPTPAPLTQLVEQSLAGKTLGKNDTVAWRESKPGGRRRVFICGPTSDQIAEGLKHLPDPLEASEMPQVLCTARDLRGVRRVAVVAVRAGVGGQSGNSDDGQSGDNGDVVVSTGPGRKRAKRPSTSSSQSASSDSRAQLTRRLAVKAASELRALDAFEVLERAALSEVLGEIALGQAGITKATDRARVRQLAAADALLLVEITEVAGRTDYSAKHRRLSPQAGSPPRRPNLPSRTRLNVSVSGDEVVQRAVDGVLGKVLGRKSDDDYARELRIYERELLPVWQRQMTDYENLVRYGTINWEETITASTNVSVSGSIRLVDLTDGLVLWEAPFTATDGGRATVETRNVTSRGEDSHPEAPTLPATKTDVPDELVSRAAETAVTRGIGSLRGTALLPTTAPPPVTFTGTTAKENTPQAPTGKILDVDGDTLLIGLGVADGLKKGDTLTINLGDGQGAVMVTVTRVRPRTCDAMFADGTDVSLRGRVTVGLSAQKEP